jgi:hypothetical protein
MSGLTIEFLTQKHKKLLEVRDRLQKSLSDAEIAIHQTTGRLAELEGLIAEIKKEQS